MENCTELKETVVGTEFWGWEDREDGEVRKDNWEFSLGTVKFEMFSTHLSWFVISNSKLNGIKQSFIILGDSVVQEFGEGTAGWLLYFIMFGPQLGNFLGDEISWSSTWTEWGRLGLVGDWRGSTHSWPSCDLGLSRHGAWISSGGSWRMNRHKDWKMPIIFFIYIFDLASELCRVIFATFCWLQMSHRASSESWERNLMKSDKCTLLKVMWDSGRYRCSYLWKMLPQDPKMSI